MVIPEHWKYLRTSDWYEDREAIAAARGWPLSRHHLAKLSEIMGPTDEKLAKEWKYRSTEYVTMPWSEAPDYCPGFEVYDRLVGHDEPVLVGGGTRDATGVMRLWFEPDFFTDGASGPAIDTPQTDLPAYFHDLVYRANRRGCFRDLIPEKRERIRLASDRMIGRIMKEYVEANGYRGLRAWAMRRRADLYTWTLSEWAPTFAPDAWPIVPQALKRQARLRELWEGKE